MNAATGLAGVARYAYGYIAEGDCKRGTMLLLFKLQSMNISMKGNVANVLTTPPGGSTENDSLRFGIPNIGETVCRHNT